MDDSKFKIDALFIKLGFSNKETDKIVSYVKNMDAPPVTKLDIGILFINKGWSVNEATFFSDYLESVKGKLMAKTVLEEKPITNPRINKFDQVATKSDIDSIKYDLTCKNQKLAMVVILSMFWMMLIMLIVIHGYIKH